MEHYTRAVNEHAVLQIAVSGQLPFLGSMRSRAPECASKRLCSPAQAFVARPECCAFGQRHRSQQVCIDIADALAVQAPVFDEPEHFCALGHCNCRQTLQQLQHRRTVPQTSTCNLANHERMHDDHRTFQKVHKLRVAAAKMVNPHGRVDQNQAALPWRLRGAASNLGCDPPSRARRLGSAA